MAVWLRLSRSLGPGTFSLSSPATAVSLHPGPEDRDPAEEDKKASTQDYRQLH